MEPNQSRGGLGSYYHYQQPPPPPQPQRQPQPQPQPHQPNLNSTTNTTTSATTTSPTNGILSNTTDRGSHMLSYSHSVTSAVASPLETLRRKRGRPRKYGTPEQAAAAKRLSSSASASMPISPPKKKDQPLGGGGGVSSSKKSQLAALGGSVAQGFTPHIINVAAGEDVGQKIMLYMQQSKHEICILSASGSISNASLRQPATSGGNITYEGRFDILSLSGSYVRTELGGRTGGLSVCLSCTDGQIIGGGVGGPLMAAGPVQVIVGTFLINIKKDIAADAKGDPSASKLLSPVGGLSFSSVGCQSEVDSPGSQFMFQPRGMQVTPSWSTDWRACTDNRSNAGFEVTGRTGHGAQQSLENGNFEQIPD